MKNFKYIRLLPVLFIWLLPVLCTFPGRLDAQTSDQDYRVPLAGVLAEVESRYGVDLVYREEQIEGLSLTGAFWRFRPDFRETMQNILLPFDLFLVHQEGDTYRIKPYRYPEMSPEDGKALLQHLSGLYGNRTEWEQRKSELRECMFRALDLSPLPPYPGSAPQEGRLYYRKHCY